MKRNISLIALALCFVFAFDASAQMDKKEAKTWKKRIKQLTPEQYKNLLDENKSLKGQVTSLKTELSNVDDRIAEKDEQILTYQSQVGDLRQELSKAKTQAAAQPVVTNENPADLEENKGIVFKVQVGAFRKKDLSSFAANARGFGIDEEDGLMKYTMGVFREYWDADTFKKYLREMGATKAFIAAYKDGKRVDMQTVLEGIPKKKKS